LWLSISNNAHACL